MSIKTYEQAVADGSVWQWSTDANEMARADRFNQNEKFLADQDVELNNAIGTVAQGINALRDSLQQAVNGLTQTIGQNAQTANDNLTQAVQTLQSSINSIQQSVNDLDTMYATDADIVEKIRQINDAWVNADTTVQQALTQLINARYTKDEVDNLLLAKADKSNTYTKGETTSAISAKISSLKIDDIGA